MRRSVTIRGINGHVQRNAPIRLAQQRGRVVVACAFQMLCPGCVAHAIPQFKAVYELFAPQGAVVVGLHTVFEHHEAMTTTSLRAFLHENRITYPWVWTRRPTTAARCP